MAAEIDHNRFTVITPVLNGARYMQSCLDTVALQTHKCSHIVVDGGSTDGTVDILNATKDTKVVLSPQTNIYEALNIGIGLAETDYVCFLNCDDYYHDPHVLEDVHHLFQNQQDVAMIYGQCDFVDADGKHLYFHKPPERLTFERCIDQLFVVSHPSCFFKKTVFERFGLYDPDIPLAADCDFVLRILEAQQKCLYLKKPLSKFRLHTSNASVTRSAEKDWQRVCEKFSRSYSVRHHHMTQLKNNIFNFQYLFYLLKRRFGLT